MAQLPPKVPPSIVTPTAGPNWAGADHFPGHQKMDTHGHGHSHSPSWVDEFLDFSSSRRGSHRRSMSDSVAFLDGPMADECRRSSIVVMDHGMNINANNNGNNNAGDFERFDDDQLMSMFSTEVGPTLSNDPSSSPSDHNSINDDEKMMMMMMMDQEQLQGNKQLKSEPEEVQSSLLIGGGAHATVADNSNEKIVDPKRIKRILANRQSAQRSRVRKLQYISELERSVTSLQAEVSVLSPRVAFLDHQRLVLNVDNSVLNQRIAALAQDKLFKDAHQEALKREIERLRQIYYEQNLKKMENAEGPGAGGLKTTPSTAADTKCPTHEKEQLAAAAVVN